MDQLLDDINNEVEIANKRNAHKRNQKHRDQKLTRRRKRRYKMRRVAIKSLGETRKRRFTWKQRNYLTYRSLPKRRMRSETLVYLRESADAKREDEKLERERRKQELELKPKEHDERCRQTNMVMQQIQQQ